MITKIHGKYHLVCDNCEDASEEEFDSFQDAVDNKKEAGFVSKKYANGWMDLCNDCQ